MAGVRPALWRRAEEPIYAARDEAHNNAVALRDVIVHHLSHRAGASAREKSP
jgi:hypothetical protein